MPRRNTAAANRMLYWNKLQAPVSVNGALYSAPVAHPNSYAKLARTARAGQWLARKVTGRPNYSKVKNDVVWGPREYSPHARRTVQVGPNVPKSLLVQRPSLRRAQLNGLANNFKQDFPFGRTASGRAVLPDPRRAIVKAPNFTGFAMVNKNGKRTGRITRSRRLTPNMRTRSLGKVGAAEREQWKKVLSLVERVRGSSTPPRANSGTNSGTNSRTNSRPRTPSLLARGVRRFSS